MTPHVYIEYHDQDRDLAETITRILTENNIFVQASVYCNIANYKEHVESVLKEYDSIIWIVSKHTKEKDLLGYYQEISFIEEKEQNTRLLPIYAENSLPIFRFSRNRNRFLITRSESVEKSSEELICYIKKNAGQVIANDKFREKCRNDALDKLNKAYRENKLVLFCGAGISIGSGIPSWNKLLISMFLDISNLPSSYTDVLCDKLRSDLCVSQEMLARMIKISDSSSFHNRLKRILYKDLKKDCTNTINAIVNLCSNNCRNKGVKEIITYNFDDLLEQNFEKNNIKYNNDAGEGIPIHHVHGLLSHNEEIRDNNQIVFSEDEYHEEYTKFASQATIKQLSALNDNVCLYVGISFTDPNMRRLADEYIKNRKNKTTDHYLIKKVPEINIGQNNNYLSATKILNKIKCLEELDAESFGFKIIWIDSFDEIPELFNVIKNKRNG